MPVSFAETVLASGTVRGRIGYAPGHWLFYATGGFAWTYNQQSLTQASHRQQRIRRFSGDWAGRQGSASKFRSRRTGRHGSNICSPTTAQTNRDYLGTQPINSDFQLHELRFGLNYQLGNDAVPAIAPIVTKAAAAPGADFLSLHGQNYIRVPSLPHNPIGIFGPQIVCQRQVTHGKHSTPTLFAGVRPWQGAEFGSIRRSIRALVLTTHMAWPGLRAVNLSSLGFTIPTPAFNAFSSARPSISGATQKLDADINLFADSVYGQPSCAEGRQDVVIDIFDTNKYANSARTDFMNWSLINAATFDFAGDAWG